MAWNQQLSERIESLRNLLVSYATGGHVAEVDYRNIRAEVEQFPDVWDRLPRFVRTCSDLKQFWAFIMDKCGGSEAGAYRRRRDYLKEQFAPVLQWLEQGNDAPLDKQVEQAAVALNSDYVVQSWRDATERRIDDPDGAITSARTLLETVCKHILEGNGIEYDDAADLPKLYKLTAKSLNFAPDQQTEPILRQIAGGCTSVVEGVGAMRSKLGDAHGKGPTKLPPTERHAELAVNLAGALSLFLIRTWEEAR